MERHFNLTVCGIFCLWATVSFSPPESPTKNMVSLASSLRTRINGNDRSRHFLIRGELIDRPFSISTTMDRCTVKVPEAISYHPIVGEGCVWRPLKLMRHTLPPSRVSRGS